jgi:hypothetical protein
MCLIPGFDGVIVSAAWKQALGPQFDTDKGLSDGTMASGSFVNSLPLVVGTAA